MELRGDLKVLELAKKASIDKEIDIQKLQKSMYDTYVRLRKTIEDGQFIEEKIRHAMNNKKKKILIYRDSYFTKKQNKEIFEQGYKIESKKNKHCELDDNDNSVPISLMSLLKHKYSHPFKVYSKKVIRDDTTTDTIVKYYCVYIKWK